MTDKPPISLEDARKRKGKNAVRAAVEAAKPEQVASEGSGARAYMTDRGLMRRLDDRELRISGPFDVGAETLDADTGTWGLLLRFADRDGKEQTVIAARDLLLGDGFELGRQLTRRGLYVDSDRRSVAVLHSYLARLVLPDRARIVSRTGWQDVGGSAVFVLPGATIGKAPVTVLYQPSVSDASPFQEAGTLEGWREAVASRCVDNSRLTLAVCAAFAGPLLSVLGEDGGGVHLVGSSRIGKTTALRVGASVWGGQKGRAGAGFIRSWRATANAVEGSAATFSDTLLALDELGQADGRDVGDTAYMLAAGQGKDRADRAGSLRARRQFRVLFLSTGEISLADKIAEAGKRMRAGQEVRLIEVAADAGRGFGLFEQLHDAPSAEAFQAVVHEGAACQFGTAGLARSYPGLEAQVFD